MASRSASRRPLRSSLVLLLLASHALAQEPTTTADVSPPEGAGWRWSQARSITVGRQMGFGLGLGMQYRRPPIPGPSPHGARLWLQGRAGITGSRDLSLGFEAPGWDPDWRFYSLLRVERMMRTPYFGFQNQERQEDSLTTAYSNRYYRYALLRWGAYGVVQRRIAGPLWLHAGGQYRRYRTAPLRQQPTLYQRDMQAAGLPDTQRFTGVEGRIGLVFDTRDDWIVPVRGVKLEGLAAFGHLKGATLAPDKPYERIMLGAREFIRLDSAHNTILALRQSVTLSSDSLPFFMAYEQPSTWAPEDGVVGSRSIRLHGGGGQLASNRAFISVDVRRILIPPDWPERERRLWVLGFADLGVLWEPGRAASLRRREWTAGAGFRIQIGRAFLSGADLGLTNNGPSMSVLSQFAF